MTRLGGARRFRTRSRGWSLARVVAAAALAASTLTTGTALLAAAPVAASCTFITEDSWWSVYTGHTDYDVLNTCTGQIKHNLWEPYSKTAQQLLGEGRAYYGWAFTVATDLIWTPAGLGGGGGGLMRFFTK